MPAAVSITLGNDADFYQIFSYRLPDGVTPINITGSTFTWGIRRSLSDTGMLLKLTSALSNLPGTQTPAGQVSIWNGPLGQFSAWLTKEALQALPVGTWAHSMIINMPSPQSGVPALRLPVWGNSVLTIGNGPSR